MRPLACAHCGAPAQIPPGTLHWTCPYCKHSFQLEPDPPPPPPQNYGPPPAIPQIVIIAPGAGHSYDANAEVSRAVGRAAAGAATGFAMSWIFGLLVPLVVAGIIVGSIFWSQVAPSSFVWDGKQPFECSGNDRVSVSDVKAEFTTGTAVIANGNCHFTCTNCTIKAPVAVEAGGNAEVVFVNGTVEGTDTLFEAGGNARVEARGNAKTKGTNKRSANAKVTAPTEPAASAAASAAPPATAATTAAPKPAPAPSPKKR